VIEWLMKGVFPAQCMAKATLHMLASCPYCWKVRSLLDHLGVDHERKLINPMRTKKELAFTDDWSKVPVWVEADGEVVVDSTPIMLHIDEKYNAGRLFAVDEGSESRRDRWLEWVDDEFSKVTVPVLYGSLGSAISTTRTVGRLERFNPLSKFFYKWSGFLVMWGIIARSRRKKLEGRRPAEELHRLLDMWCAEFQGSPFFGGEVPDGVDIAAFGIARSLSPFRQWADIESHEAGIDWYRRVESTLKVI